MNIIHKTLKKKRTKIFVLIRRKSFFNSYNQILYNASDLSSRFEAAVFLKRGPFYMWTKLLNNF